MEQADLKSWNPKVFLNVHYFRAGSNMFNQLHDNHPQVIQWPFYFHDFFRRWPDHGRKDVTVPYSQVLAWFEPMFRSWAFPDTEMRDKAEYLCGLTPGRTHINQGPNRDKSLLMDWEIFAHEHRKLCGESTHLRDCFLATHLAYWRATGHEWSDLRDDAVVLHGLHARDYIAGMVMKRLFDKVGWICSIREPTRGYASQIHDHLPKMGRHFAFDGSHAQDFADGLFAEGTVPPGYKREECMGVRLEDFHARPEATTRAVANWMGIEWQPSLMETTWLGEVFYQGPVTGLNPTLAKRPPKKDVLDDFDILRLRALLEPKLLAWGYPTVEWADYPALVESLKLPFRYYACFPEHEQGMHKQVATTLVKWAQKRVAGQLPESVPLLAPVSDGSSSTSTVLS